MANTPYGDPGFVPGYTPDVLKTRIIGGYVLDRPTALQAVRAFREALRK